ncbi:hypothetical protein [Teredinibacter turnerae]|uniref:hypothetical protein n=1 Tax=Teredinibacter turnerae TaxID=2426 RepID=UPI00036C691F|nr:hypothetical protein [Teredinibacter turnerae]
MFRLRLYLCFLSLVSQLMLTGCGGGSDGGNSNIAGSGGGSGGKSPSNNARFEFTCDLGGIDATLVMNVEAVSDSGVVFGAGPNPEVSGVVSTGSVTYYTSGTVTSPTAAYIFTGENNFADFTDLGNSSRFRVQWMADGENLIMLVNPFGPGPSSHNCTLDSAGYV